MKEKFIKYFMSIAKLTAELSYAERLKVGTVIVKGDRIIGTGYNGMPSGWENKCENKEFMHIGGMGADLYSPEEIEERWPYTAYSDIDDAPIGRYRLVTKPETLHAESNAILKVARSTESSEDAVLFTTHSPCLSCAKLIYQSGIKTVYFVNEYRDDSGLIFLRNGGVIVRQTDE